MCGIVGYIGSSEEKSVSEILVTGLKKLEYRGYDSSGIAVLEDSKVKRVRAAGKLNHLEKKLEDQKFKSEIGIAHTRWATHGLPTENNAHPHSCGSTVIVHNGIIENFRSLLSQRPELHSKLKTETDSELIAVLLDSVLSADNNHKDEEEHFLQSCLKVQQALEGAFAVLALNEKTPDTLIGWKFGPPLIVGKSKNGSFAVASDVCALPEDTEQLLYLNDHDLFQIKKNEFSLFAKGKKAETIQWEKANFQQMEMDKKGYSHYMLKEVHEQPRAVREALMPFFDFSKREFNSTNDELSKFKELISSVSDVLFVACGTSFYAGLIGQSYFERLSHLPTRALLASEYRYGSTRVKSTTLAIFISQSGETADTLAAIRKAKLEGLTTLCITNSEHSSINREADLVFSMNCGVEIGVASTKAFTSSVTVLSALAAIAGSTRKILKEEQLENVFNAWVQFPSQMESLLSREHEIQEMVLQFDKIKGFLFLGRQSYFPIALEGALKLKELAYCHAEAYASGELKHGPLALIDENVLTIGICPNDELIEKNMSNFQEVAARKGPVLLVGPTEVLKSQSLTKSYIQVPKAHWVTDTLLHVIPLQLFAFYLALNKGHDVDQPRNLAKSVTVE